MNSCTRPALAAGAALVLALFTAGHGSVYPPPLPPVIASPNTGPATGIGDIAGPVRPRSGAGAARPSGARPAGSPASGVPGAGGPGAPGNPMTVDAVSADRTSWHWWWEFNKEPFMQLRARVDQAGATSGGDGFFLGHGNRVPRRNASRRPTEAQIGQEILPALRAALATRESNDMVSGCLVALARVGNDRPAAERGELATVIRMFLVDSNRPLAEVAVVALGILGHEPNALILGDILLDSEGGRAAVGDDRVPDRMRAFAAYALAVLGAQTQNVDVRRYVVHRLARALAEDDSGSPDLSVACVTALGRVPLPWRGPAADGSAAKDDEREPVTSSRESQLRFLSRLLADKDVHRYTRAHAATALGALLVIDAADTNALLEEEVEKTLLRHLTAKRRIPREVKQSCAIALGMVGDGDEDPRDADIREALLETARNEGDIGTRHFALLSLGRVASRPGTAAAADPSAVRTYFLDMLPRAGTQTGRWAALGLALLERGRTDAGATASPAGAQALHTLTGEATSPTDAAAYSIASGILRDPAGIDEVLGQLERQSADVPRGYAAMALGLLDAQEARDPLRALVEESTYRPWLLRGTALALGMLGDPDVVDVLLGRLRDTGSLAAKASIARALGRIGDDRTVEPLLEMLTSEEGTKASRAFAAIALGLVADEDALPWNTILSVNVNYMAAPPTLHDDQGSGVLNIL